MHPRQVRLLLTGLTASVVAAAAGCGAAADPGQAQPTLRISSIPDQDPDKLAARDTAMARYLAGALGVKVDYVPVTDYAATVSLFRSGDLDLVFYGGLTGTQARLRTPGSTLIAQRDIDAAFRTVFIANAGTGIRPFSDVGELTVLKGRRFTFGSESSTSGRLMPEYFLDRAGVSATDLAGPPGFSGSHDKTIDLVESGTYEAGALNIQVWQDRLAARSVDTTKVTPLFVTPPYHDYHWLAGPETEQRFGDGFTARLRTAMLAISPAVPDQAQLLTRYGAKAFIPTDVSNYREIESIARKLKLIV